VVSASVALMLTSQPATYDCRTPCDSPGPFVEIEPGLGGGKLSFGWARVTGVTNRGGFFLKAGYVAMDCKLIVLRTWRVLGWAPANRTFVGFELGIPVARANVGFGGLHRVAGGGGRSWTVTRGVSSGF
jgi:hypothetical protein